MFESLDPNIRPFVYAVIFVFGSFWGAYPLLM